MDELEQAAPFDPPSLDQILAEITPPAQTDLETAIAETVAQAPDNIPELEVSVEELTRVRQDLEAALHPIEDARDGVAEAQAAAAEARTVLEEAERLNAEPPYVDELTATERALAESKMAADEARRQLEEIGRDRAAAMTRRQYAEAEDTKFYERYGTIDPAEREGVMDMLAANLSQNEIVQSWNCEAGIALRNSFLQGCLLDAWRFRNQPKQQPAPRPVEQPRPQPIQPRQDDGESPLTPRAAARLLAQRRST